MSLISDVIAVRKVVNLHDVPNGTYRGIWQDCEVTVEVNGDTLKLETEYGVGAKKVVDCDVIAVNGVVKVERRV